jgi:osmoprotectant transport system ATP-binding protein
VTKLYGENIAAVDDLNIEIGRGELVVLIGPSGCGKTTTLEMINRLVRPTSGTIYIGGHDIAAMSEVALRRNVGYVIQQIGLFPHLTIGNNIGLVPKLKGWPKDKIRKRVDELLELVGLDPGLYRSRFPRELSGGQQQRIGVLRALAAEPEIILMDEPFGALDPITREVLQDELKNLQQKLKKTVVFVTHDIDEALKLGDRIVLMRKGKVVQVDTAEGILRNPAGEFVEQFIGRSRLAPKADALSVDEVLVTNPITAPPELGLAQAVRLMHQKRVDTLLVTQADGTLAGVVSARDIERQKDEAGRLGDILSTDFASVRTGTSAKEAFEALFLEKSAGFVPVVDDAGRLRGIVTRTSLADMLYQVIWNSAGDRGEEGQSA